MINRRLLRIKVLQVYYAYVKKDNASLNSGENELLHSIEKSFDLYYLLFQLIIDIVTYAESRINLARQKRMPTYDDLHPNTAFIDLWFIKELSHSPSFNSVINQKKLSWINYQEVIKKLFLIISESDDYQDFITKPIDIVCEVLETFDIKADEQVRSGLNAHLKQNKKDKHGSHTYRLEDYGLDAQRDGVLFENYCSRFNL